MKSIEKIDESEFESEHYEELMKMLSKNTTINRKAIGFKR